MCERFKKIILLFDFSKHNNSSVSVQILVSQKTKLFRRHKTNLAQLSQWHIFQNRFLRLCNIHIYLTISDHLLIWVAELNWIRQINYLLLFWVTFYVFTNFYLLFIYLLIYTIPIHKCVLSVVNFRVYRFRVYRYRVYYL